MGDTSHVCSNKKEILESVLSSTSEKPKSTRKVKWVLTKKQKLYVKRLSQRATIPSKRSPNAAGFDLTVPVPISIEPKSSRIVSTELALQIPSGYYGRIAVRSELQRDYHLTISDEIIDSGFNDEVKLNLWNKGQYAIDLPENYRIAQIIITKIAEHEVEEVNDLNKLKSDENELI